MGARPGVVPPPPAHQDSGWLGPLCCFPLCLEAGGSFPAAESKEANALSLRLVPRLPRACRGRKNSVVSSVSLGNMQKPCLPLDGVDPMIEGSPGSHSPMEPSRHTSLRTICLRRPPRCLSGDRPAVAPG